MRNMFSPTTLQSSTYQQACPACGLQLAFHFYTGHPQPLATLGWPMSAQAAQEMETLPLEFVRCLGCGHIYNRCFDYHRVPYVSNPNRMYNHSPRWQRHLEEICNQITPLLPTSATIIEIGCGEGLFLQALAQHRPDLTLIGFDPNISPRNSDKEIIFHSELFVPAEHLKQYVPDLIISRHVLEHLMNPRAFLQELQLACTYYNQQPLLLLEVPCIDKALAQGRLEDFYYEHNSHFTQESFQGLLQHICAQITCCQTSYDEEVIWGIGKLALQPNWLTFANSAFQFTQQAYKTQDQISTTIEELGQQHETVVIWGGTGKSATFINTFGLDAQRFPWVIDSDREKAGTFVPGMGQRIHPPECLRQLPNATIVITTQWRAHDIVQEIRDQHLPYRQILVVQKGELVPYSHDANNCN